MRTSSYGRKATHMGRWYGSWTAATGASGTACGPPPAPTPAGATQHPLSPLSSEGVDKVLVLCHTPESVGGRRQFKLPQTSCIHFSGDVSHLPPPPPKGVVGYATEQGSAGGPAGANPLPPDPTPAIPADLRLNRRSPLPKPPTPFFGIPVAAACLTYGPLPRTSEDQKHPSQLFFSPRFEYFLRYLSFPGLLPSPFRCCALTNVFRDTLIFKVFKIPINYLNILSY